MGNLGSLRRALERLGVVPEVSGKPDTLRAADRIVLPGVGSFKDGMANLHRAGMVEPLRKAVLEERVPLLGICLGLQLLADEGDEGGGAEGLGLIPGKVVRLQSAGGTERIPHVGWNEIHPSKSHALLTGIPKGSDFYFVHSYHLLPVHPDDIIATTPYCGSFVSAVARGPASGVQFHPEKSSRLGFALLRNFLGI